MRYELGADTNCRAFFTEIDAEHIEVIGIGLPGADTIAKLMPIAEARRLWDHLVAHGFQQASVQSSDADADYLLLLAYRRACVSQVGRATRLILYFPARSQRVRGSADAPSTHACIRRARRVLQSQ